MKGKGSVKEFHHPVRVLHHQRTITAAYLSSLAKAAAPERAGGRFLSPSAAKPPLLALPNVLLNFSDKILLPTRTDSGMRQAIRRFYDSSH